MILLLLIPCLIAILIAAGILFQRMGAYLDRRRHTSHGRWVRTHGGRELYVFEKGEGRPVVLFESGIAATHLNWRRIQESVASFARTASYDRMGLGRSEEHTCELQ